MFKKMLSVLAVLALLATPALAGKLTVNTTSHGQFADLKVLGAENSAVSGNEATIDIRDLTQSSATGAAAVLTLDQDDEDYSLLAFECSDAVTGDTCSHHTTTTAAKAGSIKISVNGDVRYLRYYEDSD